MKTCVFCLQAKYDSWFEPTGRLQYPLHNPSFNSPLLLPALPCSCFPILLILFIWMTSLLPFYFQRRHTQRAGGTTKYFCAVKPKEGMSFFYRLNWFHSKTSLIGTNRKKSIYCSQGHMHSWSWGEHPWVPCFMNKRLASQLIIKKWHFNCL